uniref:Putative salivary secreted peptide n=1 Tax=Ixodes pacificus TaxID=29930 RepID=Q6B873_IXOPA|nr:putative salivary secreted peptide [Ixodes pacificus]
MQSPATLLAIFLVLAIVIDGVVSNVARARGRFAREANAENAAVAEKFRVSWNGEDAPAESVIGGGGGGGGTDVIYGVE